MPATLRIGVALPLLAGLLAIGMGAGPPGPKAKAPPAKPRPRITISKETTYLTGPLRPDGYVDYVAALNAELSRGVTPANNAAVPLLLAFGPEMLSERGRKSYCKMLGIPVPPAEGPYFVPFDKFVKRLQEAGKLPNGPAKEELDQFDAARKRPWSKDEFPTVAAWLDANRLPLARIAEAAARPRCYFPLAPPTEPPMIAILLPMLMPMREAGQALTTRAMLRLQAGKTDEAWQDLLACHRLARHAGQGATLIDDLVAIALERTAMTGEAGLLYYGHPTSAQVRRIRTALASLPVLPKMADRLDHAERFIFLDTVAWLARKGLSHVSELAGSPPQRDASKGLFESLALAGLDAMVDWDEPLRMGNRWYNRLVAAARKPARAERAAASAALEKDIRALSAGAKDPNRIAERLLERMPRQALGHWMGEVVVSLLMPGLTAVTRAEDRIGAETAVRDVALALAAYRADHGKYPARLTGLEPKYRAETKDPFSSGDLIYRPAGEGYLLYSVGPNGKDDGGRNYQDYSNDETPPPGAGAWDDIAIRMPVPSPPPGRKVK